MNNASHDQPIRFWQSSPTIANLASALARAQGEFQDVEKSQSATITTRSGAKYSYSFAPLPAIISMIRQPLSKYELSFLQPIQLENAQVIVTTLVLHSSGEFISATLALPIPPDASDARSIASMVSYGKRYSLCAMLGIAPRDDSDDDADTASPKPTAARTPSSKPAGTSKPDVSTDASAFITHDQRQHLWNLARKAGWSEFDYKSFLIASGIGQSTKILKNDYAAVVSTLERELYPVPPAPTPVAPPREKGGIPEPSRDDDRPS